MTMGLKIHRMMKEESRDDPEIKEEAKRRKDMSDSILEIIYNKIIHKNRDKKGLLEDEETEDWD